MSDSLLDEVAEMESSKPWPWPRPWELWPWLQVCEVVCK